MADRRRATVPFRWPSSAQRVGPPVQGKRSRTLRLTPAALAYLDALPPAEVRLLRALNAPLGP